MLLVLSASKKVKFCIFTTTKPKPVKPVHSLLLLLLTICQLTFAQKKAAFISGTVTDENEKPLSNVSVSILGRQSGIITNDSGTFRMQVPVDRAFALVFSFTGYKTAQRNFLL